MRAYVREIHGKPDESKPITEDSHYQGHFSDKNGIEWDLFMVADGLKKHRGRIASNMALYSISSYLGEKIRKARNKDHQELIKEALLRASNKLESFEKESSDVKPCTTLDLLLVSREDLYIAHLGDSRIYLIGNSNDSGNPLEPITKDEGDGSGPLNYIGTTFIEGQGKHIRDRIDEAVEHRRIVEGSYNYALLTTDGLMTRATDDQITQALRHLGKYSNPQLILDDLAKIIDCPKEKLLEQPRLQLEHLLEGVKGIESGGMSQEDIVDWIIANYVGKKNQKLIEKLDRGFGNGDLKSDDTTMMIVDFSDQLERSLSELQKQEEEIIPGLRQTNDGSIEKYDEEKRQKEELSRRIEAQGVETRGLQDRLREKGSELEEALAEQKALEEKLDDEKKNYQALKTMHEKIKKAYDTVVNFFSKEKGESGKGEEER